MVFEGNVESHLVHLNSWQSGKCLKSAWPEGNVVEHFSQVRGYGGLYKLGYRGSLASDLADKEGVASGACASRACASRVCLVYSSWISFYCFSRRARSSRISFCCLVRISKSLLRT